MRIIVLIVLIWIVGSCLYGQKTGEFDKDSILAPLKTELQHNPVAKIILVVVALLIVKVMFF